MQPSSLTQWGAAIGFVGTWVAGIGLVLSAVETVKVHWLFWTTLLVLMVGLLLTSGKRLEEEREAINAPVDRDTDAQC